MKKLLSILLVLLLLAALPARAVDFVPSVEYKPSPDIISQTNEEGEVVDFIVYDENDEEIELPISKNDILEIVVTTIVEIKPETLQEIKDGLNNALTQVEETEVVTDLVTDIKEALEEFKEKSDDPVIKTVEVSDLIATMLFDTSLILNNIQIFKMPDGSKIRFSIQTDFRPGDLFFVLHNYEDDKWELVRDYTINDDGVVTITVDSLSPFAILSYVKDDLEPTNPDDEDDDKPISPPTGESDSNVFFLPVLLTAVFILPVLYRVHRKQQIQR